MTRHALSLIIACAVITSIMGLGLSSCSKDEYTSRLRELIINDVQFDALAGSQTQTFRKENLSNYEASSDQDWCMATMNSSGLTVSVKANNTYDERTATVTLKDKKDGTSRTIQVSQASQKAIIVNQATYEVAADGGEVSITVKHNTDFTIKMPDVDWITQTTPTQTRALDSTVVVLTVAKNNSGAVREATLAVIYTATGKANKITINQAFTPVFSLNTEELSIDENGGYLQILVKANITLNVTYDDEWLSDGNSLPSETKAWENGNSWMGVTRSDDVENEDTESDLYHWQKVKVEPFCEKKSSRSATVTFSNFTYDIYQQVTITQKRPLFIQAVSVTLTEGDTYDMPLINSENAAVVWTSDNTDVAAIDVGGKVTAKSAGTATITVTSSDGNHSDTATVTVERAAFTPEFSVNPTTLTIDESGGEMQLLVKTNVNIDVSFSDSWLTNGGKTTESDVYSYQKINVAPFTAKSASRTATVTFSNLTYDIYQQVTVTQNRPLFIQAVSATLKVEDTYDVPLNNAEGMVVTWKSSNTSVATIDAKGTVTAKEAGTTVITVTSSDGKHSDTMTVTVEAGEITPEFSVTPEALSIDENGGVLQILVKANVPISVGYSDSWISNGGTTKVSDQYYYQKIKVTAFSQKSANRSATVTFSNYTYDIFKEVTVTQNRSLFIQAVSTTLTVGGTYAVPLYNADSLVVVWTSSDTSIATVDDSGTVTAIGTGTAVIKVASSDGSHSDTVTVTVE